MSYGRGADLQISASDPPAQVAATANVVVDDGDEEKQGEGGNFPAYPTYPDLLSCRKLKQMHVAFD